MEGEKNAIAEWNGSDNDDDARCSAVTSKYVEMRRSEDYQLMKMNDESVICSEFNVSTIFSGTGPGADGAGGVRLLGDEGQDRGGRELQRLPQPHGEYVMKTKPNGCMAAMLRRCRPNAMMDLRICIK